MRFLKSLGVAVVVLGSMAATDSAWAAKCGSNGAGFDAWVRDFKAEAARNGIRPSVLDSVFSSVHYNVPTIRADRGQHSFRLSLDAFMRKRGSAGIVSRGRSMLKSNAALFDSIERRFGVSPGPLIAIWGMETGFGSFMGDQHTLSAVATLAYDCRRTDYFTDQLYAALKLVQAGTLPINSRGAAHGEIGQTQFLPKNVLMYGVDGDGDGRINLAGSRADALASTANFLRGHGWRAGAGYQPGEPNFAAIQGWNAASVYQQAIAIMGKQIEGR